MEKSKINICVKNLLLAFSIIAVINNCSEIKNDEVGTSQNKITFTEYLKNANIHDSKEFRIHKNDNNIGFLNIYGFDTWTTVGKTGVDRLVAPSVMVSNDSVLFHLIIKFDAMGKQLDISDVALISNEFDEPLRVELETADDKEYIGLMSYFHNKEMVDQLKSILNGEEVRVSFLEGNDHIYFGLSEDDKKMLNNTIKLYHKLLELKIPYYKNNSDSFSIDKKRITTEIQKSKNSEAYNIYEDFEAYFPSKPQINQSEYLKSKNIFHCFAEDEKNFLRYDASRYKLAEGTVINDFVSFMDSFLKGEQTSVNGEVFHKRKIFHHSNEAYYYVLIYDSENMTVVKHSILMLGRNYLYKWSVQGYDGISEVQASEIFNKKKELFNIL